MIRITLLGNDRLDMMITGSLGREWWILLLGKETDIEKSLLKIYDGNKIDVKIIDFRQLKDINYVFENIIKSIMKMKKKWKRKKKKSRIINEFYIILWFM